MYTQTHSLNSELNEVEEKVGLGIKEVGGVVDDSTTSSVLSGVRNGWRRKDLHMAYTLYKPCKPCCITSDVMCVTVCVVNGTRKILPETIWLCSEEHIFAKEVE